MCIRDRLSASGYPLENDAERVPEPVTITDVVWESDTEYDDNAGLGSYLFTPVLPTGYTCEKDVELPEIYVRIGAANVVLGVQDDVLDVTFNDNGSGGISMDDNEMKEAIATALNGRKEDSITIIKLTGSVTELSLIHIFRQKNGTHSRYACSRKSISENQRILLTLSLIHISSL